MADKYVPAEDVADVFSMTVHAVRGWRRKGTIPDSLFIKVGGHYRYDLEGIVGHFRGVTTSEADKPSEDVVEVVDEALSEYVFGADEDF